METSSDSLQSHDNELGSEHGDYSTPIMDEEERRKNSTAIWIVPLIIVCIAIMQVSASEVTSAIQKYYHAPFCIMWVHAIMLSPLYFIGARLQGVDKQKFSPEIHTAAKLVVFFFGANYAYVRALRLAPASYVQAIFGTAPAIVVLLSRFWLKEEANIVRWLGVSLAFCGIAILALSSEEEEKKTNALSALFGLVLAEIAVFNAAIYKVFFKKCFGAPPPSFVLYIVGLVGMLSAVIGSPIAIMLVLTKIEDPPILSLELWAFLLVGGILDVIYNTLIAIGLAIADSPVYIAIATILAVPLSATVDALLYHLPLTWTFLLGTILVLISFALVSFAPSFSLLLSSLSSSKVHHTRVSIDDDGDNDTALPTRSVIPSSLSSHSNNNEDDSTNISRRGL